MPHPVTDPSGTFLPPDLRLSDDDVLEAVEVVGEGPHGEADLDDAEPEVEVLSAADEPRTSGFDGVGTRRESRERALALLYEAEQKGNQPLASIIDELPVPPEAFAGELVVGVSDHLEQIDTLISRFSERWSIERMPAIDRALLRVGTYELAHTDVPVGACISEAVELGKRYSTDDSHKFLNGMLARIAAEVRD